MNDVKTEAEVPLDVLEEDPFRADLGDDARDVGPEVALVFLAAALAGGREGLAGIPRSDDLNDPAPRAAVEGLEIVPDRSFIQCRICHPRHEDGRCVGFSFDVTHSSVGRLRDLERELDSSSPGT